MICAMRMKLTFSVFEKVNPELVASPTFAVAQSRTGKKVNPLNRISWVFHNLARRSFYFTEH